MIVATLSVGQPADIGTAEKPVMSGIRKHARDGLQRVEFDGIEGDGQADLSVHGGRDKAVYAYPGEHYAHWQQFLSRPLAGAQFGENLTTQGYLESDMVLGSRIRIGSAQFVLAQPRLPCFKLGLHVDDPTFPATFLHSGLLGVYLRVEKPGELSAGDAIEVIDVPPNALSVDALWRAVFVERGPAAVLDQAAQLPFIDAGWQRRIRALHQKAGL